MAPSTVGDPVEHGARPGPHPVGEVGALEQAVDLAHRPVGHVRGAVVTVMVVVVVVVVVVGVTDVRPGGADPAALHALEADGVAVDAEAGEHIGRRRRHRRRRRPARPSVMSPATPAWQLNQATRRDLP